MMALTLRTLVIVLLVAVFSTSVQSGDNACEDAGGNCVSKEECEVKPSAADCEEEDEVCCITPSRNKIEKSRLHRQKSQRERQQQMRRNNKKMEPKEKSEEQIRDGKYGTKPKKKSCTDVGGVCYSKCSHGKVKGGKCSAGEKCCKYYLYKVKYTADMLKKLLPLPGLNFYFL
ncbi:uncharacterized protein LOC121873611 [Homarus americanus]|uniref:uncharacterized protein LOC121873611 n=1 Tax=Homarus americanus TaxID=6706 RepID=UPI001C47FFE7|nr:uncharacterized protein LOC121873611 [Homarus americanus]